MSFFYKYVDLTNPESDNFLPDNKIDESAALIPDSNNDYVGKTTQHRTRTATYNSESEF